MILPVLNKIKKHGVKQSVYIGKQKFRKLSKILIIKNGRYSNFTRKSIETSNQKIKDFLNSTKVNAQLTDRLSLNKTESSSGSFFLLGNDYNFKDKINWHFNSNDINKSYPKVYSDNIPIHDFKKLGDFRVTWELNRHHHFVWLMQKYIITSDDEYRYIFEEQLFDWIENNEPGFGINYVSPMEIAIRLTNWIVALHLYSQCHSLADILNDKLIKSILGQTLYLHENMFLKRKFRNNHSIVELAGLILVQSIIKWERIDRLTKLYQNLFAELEEQFYSDGINFEHSPTYTRFTIESLLHVLLFVNEKEAANKKLRELSKKYVSALRKFVKPDYSMPMFSDCDNGRILFLGGTTKDFMDFRGFFDFCGIYFNDDSLMMSSHSSEVLEETKWMAFISNTEIVDKEFKISNYGKYYFHRGGYYISNTEKHYFAFKSGYPGNLHLEEEYGPHVHNDLLSFELYFQNDHILVDSGTYTYNSEDGNFREYFRSVKAHNVIFLNDEEQFEHFEAFGARNFPKVSLTEISDSEVKGEINFSSNITISRLIKFGNDKFEFTDELHGLSVNDKISLNLNFHPDIRIQKESLTNYRLHSRKHDYNLTIESDRSLTMNSNILQGWVSDFYNLKTANSKLLIDFLTDKESITLNWNLTPIL